MDTLQQSNMLLAEKQTSFCKRGYIDYIATFIVEFVASQIQTIFLGLFCFEFFSATVDDHSIIFGEIVYLSVSLYSTIFTTNLNSDSML